MHNLNNALSQIIPISVNIQFTYSIIEINKFSIITINITV